MYLPTTTKFWNRLQERLVDAQSLQSLKDFIELILNLTCQLITKPTTIN